MKVMICGGTGFIGTRLTAHLLDHGWQVTAVARSGRGPYPESDRYQYLSADTTKPGHWQEAVGDADAVVNLTGATIFRIWTEKYKRVLRDSRILTTRHVVEAFPEGGGRVLFNASGAGYYGDQGDRLLDESAPSGDDFMARLAADWETEAFKATAKGVRVAVGRFGVVLDRDGGAIEKMLPAFRMFVGGPLGDGKQWFPWIHLQDHMEAVRFVLENESAEGAFNFTAEQPVRNEDLVQTLARHLHRPAVLSAPSLMMKLVLGDLAQAFLASQRTVPKRLLESGFNFRYPDIESAMAEVFRPRE
ncbi:MAG: TIGR01777 family oxidoreductase [Desulfobacterales bacterium]